MGVMSTTVWHGVKIPTCDPQVTTRVHAAAALRQLERLRREVDAAAATVTIVLGANSRDTAAEISRATGRSNRLWASTAAGQGPPRGCFTPTAALPVLRPNHGEAAPN